MYTTDRHAYRQTFFIAWQKHQKKWPLEPVEAQLIEIILLHPEYHSILEKPKIIEQQEFPLEENPFFHMSLHLAIHEQIRTNRPVGITKIFNVLNEKFLNLHETQHCMMKCLAQILWDAQQTGVLPDEAAYLEKLSSLSS